MMVLGLRSHLATALCRCNLLGQAYPRRRSFGATGAEVRRCGRLSGGPGNLWAFEVAGCG